MKKKLKSKLILLFVVLASLFIFSGCKVGESLEDIINDRNLQAQVTYYSNGGDFNNKTKQKELYYPSGAKAIDIGNPKVGITSGAFTITRNDYEFVGWYYAVLDANGNPTYTNAEKTEFALGKAVDFSVALQTGDHWHVVAKWAASVQVLVELVCDADAQIPVAVKAGEEAISYKNGDIVERRSYNSAGLVVKKGDGVAPFQKKETTEGEETYTFVEYYEDKECTTFVQWPLRRGDTDVTIYAKYIKGEWSVLRNALDVSNMFMMPSANYWLIRDIDASNSAGKAQTGLSGFSGKVYGNGYKISNLEVGNSQSEPYTTGMKVSLFGTIGANAEIKDITFENLALTYHTNGSPIDIYFAFTSITAGAQISNVQLSGTMKISKPTNNVVNASFYGGYDSDEAYLEESQNQGFVVAGTASEVITFID